jgi:hypothetical protein
MLLRSGPNPHIASMHPKGSQGPAPPCQRPQIPQTAVLPTQKKIPEPKERKKPHFAGT